MSGAVLGSWRPIAAWCFFDWANSAFPTIIGFVFVPYFIQEIAKDPTIGTAQWGWAFAISALGVAILSPVLGAICDKGGRQKPWLALFTVWTVMFVAALWWVRPGMASVAPALVLFALANLGFELSYVAYNAMLRRIAPPGHLGKVSGWGWGMGYLGALASLALIWTLFLRSGSTDVLSFSDFDHERVSAPLAALWFALFAIPLFLFVPDASPTGLTLHRAVREGLREVTRTIAILRHHRPVAWFLAAHMLYIDGLNTLFVFGPIVATTTFEFNEIERIQFALGLYVVAGGSSILFGWLEDQTSPKRLILLSITALTALGFILLMSHGKTAFWVLGLSMGAFIGPIQSMSRSYMAKLAPPQLMTQMFGLYALAGRLTAALGPALVGWITLTTGSHRIGLAPALILLAAGAVVLLLVRESE